MLMPSHRTHKLIDRIFLHNEYKDVHEWMDGPVKYLGPRHRILRHSIPEILAKYWNDPRRLMSAYLHLVTDFSHSEVKKKIRRRRK